MNFPPFVRRTAPLLALAAVALVIGIGLLISGMWPD
jgi:hypothetical protein